MPRTDSFTVPDAIWDADKQTCYDPRTHDPLPNYTGLVLLPKPRPCVMNTWLEGSRRMWQFVCTGWNVPNKLLD